MASVKPDGSAANGRVYGSAISRDGRFVAFSSDDRLTADDTNGLADVYVRDAARKTTTLVSRGMDGKAAGGSGYASVSDDGRVVAFTSYAKNLVSGGSPNGKEYYVADLAAHTTRRVLSQPPARSRTVNAFALMVSGDGTHVVYMGAGGLPATGDDGDDGRVYELDLTTGERVRVTEAPGGGDPNGRSSSPTVSRDGRYVTFLSDASNLVAGDRDERPDVFVWDRDARATRLVLSPLTSEERPAYAEISPGGRYLCYEAESYDRSKKATRRYVVMDVDSGVKRRFPLPRERVLPYWPLRVSDDGLVAYRSWENSSYNAIGSIYLADPWHGTLQRIARWSHYEDGPGSNENSTTISADGRHVVYESGASVYEASLG